MEDMSRPEETSEQPQAMKGKGQEAIYEIGFLLVPTLTEGEIAEAFERLHPMLARAGGIILAEEAPKKIPLAYRIERSVEGKREKYADAYFGFIKFEFSTEEDFGEKVNDFEKALREDPQLLRHLIIKTTREAPIQPKTVFASKSLEGRTIEKLVAAPEERGEVSQEELDKSIEALVGE